MRARGALAVMVAAACGATPRPAPRLIADPSLEAKIDPIAARLLTETPAAGMSVAVARGGRIVFAKGYGLARRETRTAATAATVYRIGSLSKQVTAALVMKLVERGKIVLDEAVATYLPDLPEGRRFTVRQLLTHTAGVPEHTDAAFIAHGEEPLTTAQLVAVFARKPLDFEPGTKWSYSNSGYVLLGAIVERVTGRPYREVVEEELLEPLGLEWTGYCPDRPSRAEDAAGYAVGRRGLEPAKVLSMTRPFAAGALCADVIDLARWSLALHGGKVVKKESLLQMTTPVALAGGGSFPYGFGLMLGDAEGHPVIAHSGGVNGFASYLAYFPKDDVTLAILVNTESEAADQGMRRIARAIFDIPEPKVLDEPLAADEAARYVGTYVLEIPDVPPLVVTYEDGKLYGQAVGPPVHFKHQGGGVFQAEAVDARMTFHGGGAKADSVTIEQGGGKFTAKRKP